MSLMGNVKKAVKKTVRVATPLVKPVALTALNSVAPGAGSALSKVASSMPKSLPKAAPVQRPANAPMFAGSPGQTLAVAANLQAVGVPTAPPPADAGVVEMLPGGMSKPMLLVVAAAGVLALLWFLRK